MSNTELSYEDLLTSARTTKSKPAWLELEWIEERTDNKTTWVAVTLSLNGEMALPGDPPGELQVVEGMPEGGRIQELTGMPSAFTPDYAPEEMFEIATRLYKKSR